MCVKLTNCQEIKTLFIRKPCVLFVRIKKLKQKIKKLFCATYIQNLVWSFSLNKNMHVKGACCGVLKYKKILQ